MPSKQKDKCPSLEELKAATTATIGILRYASRIIEFKDLPPELQKKIEELKKKAATIIATMRREIIAEQELLQLQLEQIDEAFKRPGGRALRNGADAGKPKDNQH